MSALPKPPLQARIEPLTPMRVAAVCAVEHTAYTHPWSEGNFFDSMSAGYRCQCVLASFRGAEDAGQPTGGSGRSRLWSRLVPGARAVASATPQLVAGEAEPTLLIGYYVAMQGVDEVHLLNITVAPPFQGQGWASAMLAELSAWSWHRGMQWLWLEARQSNVHAIDVYEHHGFRRVGVRKNYYPAVAGSREHAVVMSRRLNEPARRQGHSA